MSLRHLRFGFVLVSVVSAASVAACGGSDSGSPRASGVSTSPDAPPDFDAIDAEMNHPTGTFDHASAAPALEAYAQARAGGGLTIGLFPGSTPTSSSPTKTMATPVVASALCAIDGVASVNAGGGAGSAITGAANGSCTCPGGGEIDWDFSELARGTTTAQDDAGALDLVAKVTVRDCRSYVGDTSLDGAAYLNVRDETDDVRDDLAGKLALLFDAHLDYTSPEGSGTLDGVFRLDASLVGAELNYLVDAPSGSLVVRGTWDPGTRTGSVVVVDANDTWRCEGTDGATLACRGSGTAKTTIAL